MEDSNASGAVFLAAIFLMTRRPVSRIADWVQSIPGVPSSFVLSSVFACMGFTSASSEPVHTFQAATVQANTLHFHVTEGFFFSGTSPQFPQVSSVWSLNWLAPVQRTSSSRARSTLVFSFMLHTEFRTINFVYMVSISGQEHPGSAC